MFSHQEEQLEDCTMGSCSSPRCVFENVQKQMFVMFVANVSSNWTQMRGKGEKKIKHKWGGGKKRGMWEIHNLNVPTMLM